MSDECCKAVYFTAPYMVEVRETPITAPTQNHLLVRTRVSAISAGTELLFYRNRVPAGMPVDSTISGMSEQVTYPLHYGYACAGEVIAVGPAGDLGWIGRSVFAFHPHASHFTAAPDDVVALPQDMDAEQAAFLPNMETAVALLMDSAPLLGERVLVFGQGIVGLLVTSLLAQMPLSSVMTVDPIHQRRRVSLALGASSSFAPDDLAVHDPIDPDLIIELSGNPQALDLAIRSAQYAARIVIGSWYGTKSAELALGGHFHRSRIHMSSSQVSAIAPALTGRWSKRRRLLSALRCLETLPYRDLITHRIPVGSAGEAYELLDQRPEDALQVLLTY